MEGQNEYVSTEFFEWLMNSKSFKSVVLDRWSVDIVKVVLWDTLTSLKKIYVQKSYIIFKNFTFHNKSLTVPKKLYF